MAASDTHSISDISSIGSVEGQEDYYDIFESYIEDMIKIHNKYGDGRNHYAALLRIKSGQCEIFY
jgi:arginyl-tRNA--protein-N-Asp/Glu arginylyltransferase